MKVYRSHQPVMSADMVFAGIMYQVFPSWVPIDNSYLPDHKHKNISFPSSMINVVAWCHSQYPLLLRCCSGWALEVVDALCSILPNFSGAPRVLAWDEDWQRYLFATSAALGRVSGHLHDTSAPFPPRDVVFSEVVVGRCVCST